MTKDEARKIAAGIANLLDYRKLVIQCLAPKMVEPRGAITPGVPGLRLKSGS
jgi:hypothetical protein